MKPILFSQRCLGQPLPEPLFWLVSGLPLSTLTMHLPITLSFLRHRSLCFQLGWSLSSCFLPQVPHKMWAGSLNTTLRVLVRDFWLLIWTWGGVNWRIMSSAFPKQRWGVSLPRSKINELWDDSGFRVWVTGRRSPASLYWVAGS